MDISTLREEFPKGQKRVVESDRPSLPFSNGTEVEVIDTGMTAGSSPRIYVKHNHQTAALTPDELKPIGT